MTWQFRFRNHPLPTSTDTDNCSHIRPLLSLMSDGMASAKEAKEAEAHLQTCADCRQSLLWIDATRQVIALRPVALPPADMRARIARAIAASAETSVPAVPIAMPTVRRTFTLRPAYAAAASVALAGVFLGHYLLTTGHAPVKGVSLHPIQTASSGLGKAGYDTASKPGSKGDLPAPVLRKRAVVVAAVPSGVSGQQHSAQSSPVRQTPPVSSFQPGAAPHLTIYPASPGSATEPHVLQVAFVPRFPAAPAPAKRYSDTVASHPNAKPPAGIPTSAGNNRPLVAALPSTSAHATPSPTLVTTTPLPASTPIPATVVAHMPDVEPVAAPAASGDVLGSVRTSLASYRSEGYARRLSMANGVHLRQNFVQISAVWTPTSLSETSATRRTGVAASSRPASVQANPQAASLLPVSAAVSSNQRRSERDKQWSDVPAAGGA